MRIGAGGLPRFQQFAAGVTFRKTLLGLHLVVGLVAGILLVLLGGSGAMLVFEDEINRWLNPQLTHVAPSGNRLPLDEITTRLERDDAGAKVMTYLLPKRPDDPLRTMVRCMQPAGMRQLAIDPYTGILLGRFDQSNDFTRRLHQFHKNLLLADVAKSITMWGALLLLVLAGSGLILWWPRKLWRFGPSAPGMRGTFQLHNVLGFYSSIFFVLFAVTGLVIHWDDAATKLVNRFTGEAPMPPVPNPATPTHGVVLVGADRAIELAMKAAPGAVATSVQGIGGARAPIRVSMRFPEDHTPLGRTNIYLDPATGAVLAAQLSRTAPLGTRVAKLWNRELHTGDFYGWPTRLLACAMSLALPVLALTGPFIWWGKRRRRKTSDQ